MENVEIHTHITNVMRITILCAFHYCEINIYIYIYFWSFHLHKNIISFIFKQFLHARNLFCNYYKDVVKYTKREKKINKYNTFIVKISISRFLFFIYTYKHTCDLSWLPEGERREGKTIAKKDVEDKDRTTTMRTRVITFV